MRELSLPFTPLPHCIPNIPPEIPSFAAGPGAALTLAWGMGTDQDTFSNAP